jgi:hypothetical protein
MKMSTEKEVEWLAKEIQSTLHKLENTFWEVFVKPGEYDSRDVESNTSYHYDYEEEDNKQWLYYGTKMLYNKICLFLELKGVPLYHQIFTSKFKDIIDHQEKVMESYGGRYNESEPSMIIHDNFREFLSSFVEFDYEFSKKIETNKLKLLLENTNSIVTKTRTNVTNETSIYKPVKWVTEMIYPTARELPKARFIKKFSTYHPDILVPEISTAVEYKFIREDENAEKYIDQIKTDADNYKGDPEYKYFFAVVYYENKEDINPEAFRQAIKEKSFPDNWTIMAL